LLFPKINATIKHEFEIREDFRCESSNNCIISYFSSAYCCNNCFIFPRKESSKDEQDAQLAATAQTVTMLIIDKKRMRLNQSGLPQAVIDQTPKLMRRSKLPIVKAKVGPKVMTLIADDACFDMIPVKKEVKATVSGIYITKVTGVRGPLEKPEGKVSWRTKLKRKAESANKELQKEKKSMNEEKAAKKSKTK